jgi:hypothetical protein
VNALPEMARALAEEGRAAERKPCAIDSIGEEPLTMAVWT